MCCYTAAVAAAAAAVSHRVPDGKNCCWFVESDSTYVVFSFYSFKHDLIIMYAPLGSTVALYYGLDLSILYNDAHLVYIY